MGAPSPHPNAHLARIASHLLMIAALTLVMVKGLLPGLLCVCVGFLSTRWLSPRLGVTLHTPTGQSPHLAATLVLLIPLVLLALALPRTRGLFLDAPTQYRDLLSFLARTVLSLRDRLPPDVAAQLPEGTLEVQHTIAGYLVRKAGTLATAGRAWLTGMFYIYIGLLIGAFAAISTPAQGLKPLASQLHLRLWRFGESFRQIIVAQFWISLFNTSLTAIFLLVILPLFDSRLPYSTALILLTFVAGLVPIVGNLICNTVLTLVGLSVSSSVALACLVFLIVIHKAEYFINARIIGERVHIRVWELLAVMFVMEAFFGAAGLVAAPLFYAYAKQELEASGWV